jgi:hypothetical protein
MPSIFRGALPPVRWGAIFAGALCALAVDMVLMMFGTAMGLSAAPAESRGLGAGGAVWSVLTPVVAYFCGAYLAARVAGALKPGAAYLHGVVTWGMGIVVSGVLMAALLGSALGGAASGAGAALGNGAAVNGDADAAAARAAAGAGMLGISGLLGLIGALAGAAVGRGAVIERGDAYHARIEREPREAQGMAMGMPERRRGSTAGPAAGMPERRRASTPASPGIPERHRDVMPSDRTEQGRELPSREGESVETSWHD